MCKKNKGKIIFILGSNISGANDVIELIEEFSKERNLNVKAMKCRDAGKLDEILRKNPSGVILMNEMRQYGPCGEGMCLRSFSTGISTFVNNESVKRKIALLEIKDDFRGGGSDGQKNNINDWLQQQFPS